MNTNRFHLRDTDNYQYSLLGFQPQRNLSCYGLVWLLVPREKNLKIGGVTCRFSPLLFFPNVLRFNTKNKVDTQDLRIA
jgi:hypothetical protein